MHFLDAIQQAKAHAELRMQRLSVISNNLKAAAFRGPLWSESADEHVASRLHRTRHLLNVRYPLLDRSKKMKHSAVMPRIEGAGTFSLLFGEFASEM